MELSVFVLIQDKNVYHGKYLMESHVSIMKDLAQKEHNGMEHIVFLSIIVKLVIMEQDKCVSLSHNYVLHLQFGLMENVMQGNHVLMEHILKLEIVILICLAKKDKFGMKI